MKPANLLLSLGLASCLFMAPAALAHDKDSDSSHSFHIDMHDDRDIEDLTDEELEEVVEELEEALEEIEEAREEIAEELADEDNGHIATAALSIAHGALGGAETSIEQVLTEVEAEQAKRAKAKN